MERQEPEYIFDRERHIFSELDEWRLREDLLWKQRSRADWLKDGDRNTKFFHARASQRRKTNFISKLRDDNGAWITGEEDLNQLAFNYLGDMYQSDSPGDHSNWYDHFNHIHSPLSETAIEVLNAPFPDLEVQAAVFQMAPTKAPGPDGFSAMFFQRCWPSIKNEVTGKILNMLNEGPIEEGINDTNIVLIPKVIKKPLRLWRFQANLPLQRHRKNYIQDSSQ